MTVGEAQVGRFVAVEGSIGSGKTTVANFLGQALEPSGAEVLRYPDAFRRFRHEAALDERIAPGPRMAYYLGGALHLSMLVVDALRRRDVVCDRYAASPLSLIAASGALGPEEIDRLAGPFRMYLRAPNVTLLLTVEHAVARDRVLGRDLSPAAWSAVHRRSFGSRPFFDAWLTAMRREAGRLGPVVELDTTARTVEETCRGALAAVGERLSPRGTRS